jgi:uncharacterized protein (TIGR03437 family)
MRLLFTITVALVLVLNSAGTAQTSLQYLDFGPNGKITATTSDSSGNIYVAGNAQDFTGSPGLNTIRIYKVSPSGFITYSFDLQHDHTTQENAGSVTALAVDSSGSLFAAGATGSGPRSLSPFPTLHPLVSSPNSYYYGFLFKLDPTGTKLLFSTLLAGTPKAVDPEALPITFITAMALDSTGAVYLTGYTDQATYPTTPGAYQNTGPDIHTAVNPANFSLTVAFADAAFVTKIPATLDRIEYSTFVCGPMKAVIGGVGTSGSLITVDDSGRAIIAGLSSSNNLPSTAGALRYDTGGMFVAKLSADGSSLVWSALLGAISPVTGAIDSSKNMVFAVSVFPSPKSILGTPTAARLSPIFPSTGVIKLNSDASAVLGSTYLSGSITESITGMRIDSQNNVWLSGNTQSPDFPKLPNSLQMGDSFLAKLSPNLDRLLQMDRLPTNTTAALTLDPSGVPILAGDTGSILRMPSGFESQPGILGVADSAAFNIWPFASPGAFLSLYGIALGPSPALGAAYDEPNHIATTLGGVSVTFDGVPASLTYAGPSQVNVIVPFAVAGQPSTRMEFRNSSGFSQTVVLPLLPATPFIFSYLLKEMYPTEGNLPLPAHFAAALNQDGSINSASNPAHSGEVISIFANGAGLFTPPLTDGTLQGSVGPTPALPVSVYFFGQKAQVLYAGIAPGLSAGVLQVNFRLGRVNDFPTYLDAYATQGNDILLVVGNYQTQHVQVFAVP